ncbi:MAG: ROK family protein [Candidatus Nanohaloarchaea archaeon]
MIAAFYVDSGETRYVAGNSRGEFLSKVFETPTRPENIPEMVRENTDELEEKVEGQIEKICIATTGRVRPSDKVIEHFDTDDHDEVTGIRFSDLEREVLIENDCNAAALGEYYFGNGSEHECSVHVTIDTGVGAGIMYKGELFRGEHGQAGEVGYFPVKLDDTHHSYGIEGAWEAYASVRGLREYLEKRTDLDLKEPTYNRLKDLADENRKAEEVLEMIDRINAAGISSLINAFNPGYISIGGRMALKSENMLQRIQETLEKSSFVEKPEIDFVNTEERVHLYGALSLERRDLE